MSKLKEHSHEEFTSWSKSYDRSILQWLLFDPSHKLILKQLDGRGSGHILDIGCGTGKLAHRLITHHRDARVFGIDFCESMIRAAGPHVTEEQRIHLGVADSQHLPFPDDAFDFITCSNSFHHYPDQQAALSEMHRVLRPGGQLFLTDGYRDNWFGHLIYDVLVTHFEGGVVHHASRDEFLRMFRQAGFQDISQMVHEFPAPFILTSGRAQTG